MINTKHNNVIFFDGVCNLCNASVNFIIKKDKNNIFKFAALQSDFAKKTLASFPKDKTQADSILYLENKKLYSKSSAVLHIAKHLNGGYPILFGFIIVPKFIRNFAYDFIAKNRYKWYGKKQECMIPTPEIKSKFIA